MEKVLQCFKNLYKGEDIKNKHFLLSLLFILPAITSAMTGVIDKDTPKSALIICGIILVVLGLLSIIPGLWLLGTAIRFYEERLMGKLGIPKVSFDTLVQGVKVFPLTFVWGLYYLVIFTILIVTPFIFVISDITSGLNNPTTSSIIFMILGMLVAILLIIAITVLTLPFFNYIAIEYVKYGHQGYLYNPLSLGKYMKLAFKETMIVFGKFWLASIVIGLAMGIIYLIFVILCGAIGLLAGIFSTSENFTLFDNPAAVISIIFLSSLISILQMYVRTMISYAATDNYIEVYKEKIAPHFETAEVSVDDFKSL